MILRGALLSALLGAAGGVLIATGNPHAGWLAAGLALGIWLTLLVTSLED
jgi:hypothetical protein